MFQPLTGRPNWTPSHSSRPHLIGFEYDAFAILSLVKNTNYGFTIIELLIVVVVIAILASVALVSYGGVQQRATTGAVQTDLRNLGQAMEMYRVEHGRYPTVFTPLSTTPQTEVEQILRQSGLYSATRANQADWNNGIFPAKRFVFCLPSDGSSRYAIVSDRPLLSNSLADDTGKTTAYVDHSGVVKTATVTAVGASVQERLCTLALGEDSWSNGDSIWSNSVPLNWAP